MQATFLITLNVESDTDLVGIAADIAETLSLDSFNVVDSKPWFRKSLSTSAQAPADVPPNVT